MRLLVIILFITSLYSHTINCADMFNIIADKNILRNILKNMNVRQI